MQHPGNLPTSWASYFVDEIEFGANYSLLDKIQRLPRVVYSSQARSRLAELLLAARPDVCHAHNIYHHISPSILGLLKEKNVPTVLTLHDLKIACPAYTMLTHDGICERCRGGRLHNVLIHRCIKNSVALSALIYLESLVHTFLRSYRDNVSLFVVPSRFYISKFVEWGMPANLFRHIPNFVAADRFRPEYQAGKAILYFGRVSREKGLDTLIRAAAIAKSSIAIVGTGPQLAALEKLAAEVGANVRFHGYLSGSELHDAVRSARAVVLPSEWYENAPMSVLEAYALGKPLIGANIGGIPELIRPGSTGLLFPSGNVDSLAEILRQVGDFTDSKIAEMGQSARQLVETQYAPAAYAVSVLSAYRELGVASALQ